MTDTPTPDPLPCPACHHPDHDPGSCPDCPRCELHVDEALIWLSRIARTDYDEFIEGIEQDALAARPAPDSGLRDRIAAIPWNPGESSDDPEFAVSEYRDAVLAALEEPHAD